MLSLWLTIGTGLALAAVEAGPRLLWFHQGRGLMTMTKLALALRRAASPGTTACRSCWPWSCSLPSAPTCRPATGTTPCFSAG